jgi:uncharacterized membrane protein
VIKVNRVEIKKRAKEIRDENLFSFWHAYIILFVISFLLSFVIELLFDESSNIYLVLTIVSSCFTLTLSVGFYRYILKMIRKENFNKSDIFEYVGDVFKILAIALLVFMFSFLGLILFIVPGIIAILSFAMVYMIYVDDQNMQPMDYLSVSKDLMKGYKWDYFVFNLSFIGWILLSILTLGILSIWTIPYISISQAIYYDELKKLKEKE